MKTMNNITINPNVRSGKPIIAGTRIAVADVLDYLAGGMSVDGICRDFPELSREQVIACTAHTNQ